MHVYITTKILDLRFLRDRVFTIAMVTSLPEDADEGRAQEAVHVRAACLVSILMLHTGHVPLCTMSVMHAVHSCTLVSVALAPQHGVRLVGPVSKHTAHSPSICGIYSVVVVSVCSV